LGISLEPTQRFSNRVENYRRYRPGYPSGVIDLIRVTGGLGAGARVADVGSGTGIFTRQLLEAGFEVSAVEPNEAMRLAAEEDLRGYPGFHSIGASAEGTGLPDQAFCAVTSAQAFHWFKREAVRLEFHRILRPGGRVFLIWNGRCEKASPFDGEYQALLGTLGQSYDAVRESVLGTKQEMADFFSEGTFRSDYFDHEQVMTWTELRGRFLSSSYAPTEDDPGCGSVLSKLEDIFRKHESGGRVKFAMTTGVYHGQM
jgi:SAM-dependent methyltransferase